MQDDDRSRLHPSAPAEPADLGELTDDAITGSFRILQRKHGHRYSLDDVITAFEAAQTCPVATRALELGSGIGSVLLMLAYKLPRTHFFAVEAQTGSYRLLTQNVANNGLDARVTTVHGDLRARVGHPPLDGQFDLITGTPPYVPPGKATPSTDAQRAYARQEYRGGVEAYVEAAARVLAPDGRVFLCADARFPERVHQAARQTGLSVLKIKSVVPRENQKDALFSVFTLAHKREEQAMEPAQEAWIARNADGTRSQAYFDVRTFFGLPPGY